MIPMFITFFCLLLGSLKGSASEDPDKTFVPDCASQPVKRSPYILRKRTDKEGRDDGSTSSLDTQVSFDEENDKSFLASSEDVSSIVGGDRSVRSDEDLSRPPSHLSGQLSVGSVSPEVPRLNKPKQGGSLRKRRTGSEGLFVVIGGSPAGEVRKKGNLSSVATSSPVYVSSNEELNVNNDPEKRRKSRIFTREEFKGVVTPDGINSHEKKRSGGRQSPIGSCNENLSYQKEGGHEDKQRRTGVDNTGLDVFGVLSKSAVLLKNSSSVRPFRGRKFTYRTPEELEALERGWKI